MKTTSKLLLKKVLVALVIVAMLVSAVVTVALAEDPSYGGNLTDAKTKLSAAKRATSPADRSTALAAVFEYMTNQETLVDPETEGYAAFVDEYHALTIECGLLLHDAVLSAVTANEQSTALAKVYIHFAGAGMLDGMDPTVTVNKRLVCELCGEVRILTSDELAAGGLPEGYVCADADCAGGTADYKPAVVKYSDFVKVYQNNSIDITDVLVETLYAPLVIEEGVLKGIGYYDYIVIQNALRNYLENVTELSYDPEVNEAYTGSLTEAEALLGSVKVNGTVENFKNGVLKVYNYLKETPVDPTSDAYKTFYDSYEAIAEQLVEKMLASADEAVSADDKVSALNSVKTFLSATSLTASCVDMFNAKVEAIKNEYLSASTELDSAELVVNKDELIAPPVYTGDITAFKGLVDAIVPVENFGEDMNASGEYSNTVIAAYGYLVANPIDPASDNYGTVMADYVAKRDEFAVKVFAFIDSAVNPFDKANLVVDFGQMLASTPLSEAIAEEYNELLAEFDAELKAAFDAVNAKDMTVSVPDVAESVPNISAGMIEQLVAAYESASDLEGRKTAIAALYRYISVSVFDHGVNEELANAIAKYDGVRTEFTAELLATVDGTDIESVKAVSLFLMKTPYSKAAVTAFNGKLAELVGAGGDKAALEALEVSYILTEMDDAVAALAATEDVLVKMDVLKDLYGVLLTARFDFSDADTLDTIRKYSEALAAFDSAAEHYLMTSESIEARYTALVTVRDFIKTTPISLSLFTIYNDAVEGVSSSYKTALSMLEFVDGTVASDVTLLKAEIEAVKALTDLDEKMAAFKALYNNKENSVIDPTDSASFHEAYDALCESFASELMAITYSPTAEGKIAGLKKVASYLKEVPFSEAVITSYNIEYAEIKSQNYNEVAEKISTAFAEPLTYTSIAALKTDFAELNALVSALNGTPEGLLALYAHLAENKYDFGDAAFAEALAAYDAEKVKVTEGFVTAITEVDADALAALEAGTLSDLITSHVAAFSAMKTFVSENCFSLSMLQAYNKTRLLVASANNSYADVHTDALVLYSALTVKVHNHMNACPIDEDVVGTDEFNRINETLDAFEYVELVGLIAGFETASGASETPVTDSSALLAKINSYLKNYPVTDGYVGYGSFIHLYNTACEKYINGLTNEIDSLVTAEEKLNALKQIRDYLDNNTISEGAVEIFNAKLSALLAEYKNVAELLVPEVDLDAAELIKPVTPEANAVSELNALLAAFDNATDLEGRKTALKAVYKYLTSKVVDTEADGYAEFLSAYSIARNKLAEELFATIDAVEASEDKYEALVAIRDYLNENPINQTVVDDYNAIVSEIAKEFTSNFNTLSKIEFKYKKIPPKETIYKGDVAKLYELINNIPLDPEADDFSSLDYNAVITAIKAVHDYLRDMNTLVDPTTTAYASSIAKYDEKHGKLTELLSDAFANAETLDEQFAAVNAMVKLVEKCAYSEDVVLLANNYSALVADEFSVLANEMKADDTKAVSPLGNLKALIDAIDETASLNKFKRAFAEFYADYKVLVLDVTDSTAETIIASFEAKSKFILDRLFEEVDAAKGAEEKYSALMTAKTFVQANPVNADLVNKYNEKLAGVKKLDYAAAKTALETAVAPVSFYKNTVAELNALLEGLDAKTTAEKCDILENAYLLVKHETIDPSEAGYDDAILAYETAYKALVDTLIAEAKGADDKAAAVEDLRVYLTSNKFSSASTDKFNRAFPEAESIEYFDIDIVTLFELLATTQKLPVDEALANINIAIKTVTADKSAWDKDSAIADANEIRSAVEAIMQDAKEKLSDQAPLDEFDKAKYDMQYDFNDGKNPWNYAHIEKHADVRVDTSNKYMNIYHGIITGGAASPFYDIRVPDSTKGLIIEFDLTTVSHDVVDFSISFVEDGHITGGRIGVNLLRVINNNIVAPTDPSKIWANNVFTRGEWTHIIIVYDPITFSAKYYVNYELIAEFALVASEPVTLTTLRVTSSGTGTSAAFDNLVAYQGTAFRIIDRFEKMSDTDKFNYYVEYFTNTANAPLNRNKAYQAANALKDKVKNEPECVKNVSVFENYDYDKNILGSAREQNLTALKELYASITTIDSTTVVEVEKTLTAIEEFIETNIQFIDQTNEDYRNIRNSLGDIRELIVHIDNTKNLIDMLTRFDRATTLTSRERHRNNAVPYYDACEFDNAERYDLVKDDPVVVSFLEKVGFDSIIDYYNAMPSMIEEAAKTDNSKRIVNCMKFITDLEGYGEAVTPEQKEAFWEANYDYINKYVLIIRGVADSYDESYEGVAEAVAAFEEMDAYFFKLLQNEHIAVMKAQLDKYPATDSYIEKKGVCTFIDKYILENDIDFEHPEIKELLARHTVYSEEVEIHKVEYQALLDQNTEEFIGLVKRMDANENDYATLKELYDYANTNLYYNMNVEVEDDAMMAELTAACEKFETYGVKLDEIKTVTEEFLASAKALAAAKTRTDIYKALTACAKTVDLANVDAGENVEEAIELYNTELADYIKVASPANELVSEANNVSSAVRSMSIAETVLSIIKNIFSK